MTKREAKRWAYDVAAGQIGAYLDVGQPYEDHKCDGCGECGMKVDALNEIARQLMRRTSR